MKTKTFPSIDEAGYFVGLTVADESPLEPGVFLLPAGAVDTAQPTVPKGQRAKWSGEAWALEAIPQPTPPTRADVIRASLAEIDTQSIRPARAVSAALAAGQPAPAFDAAKLATLETEAAALRAELAALP